jgi:hypothetical protein
MSYIHRRINTVEKKLRLGRHEEPIPPRVVIILNRNPPTAEDLEKLGPEETWITYQEQLQTQEEANAKYMKDNPCGLPACIKIGIDVDKEYQARATKSGKRAS